MWYRYVAYGAGAAADTELDVDTAELICLELGIPAQRVKRKVGSTDTMPPTA